VASRIYVGASDVKMHGENADFHTIRHPVRTELERLGVSRDGRVIPNHKNPATSIATLYDHGDYDDQKRAALCAWEEMLRTIVDDEEERSAFPQTAWGRTATAKEWLMRHSPSCAMIGSFCQLWVVIV
jgi:hypothetical protein